MVYRSRRDFTPFADATVIYDALMKRFFTTTNKKQTVNLLRLSGPLIINNLAIAGMGFADAVMAGSLGARELAAVAVGSSFWFLGFSFCLGTLMAISPIVSQHFGAGRYELISRYTRHGLFLAVLLSLSLPLPFLSLSLSLFTCSLHIIFYLITLSFFLSIFSLFVSFIFEFLLT